MEYSFIVGILSNFDFSISGWIFFVSALVLILIALSSLLYVFTRSKTLQVKILLFVIFLFFGLIIFGVTGLLVFAFTIFACYAFITDFTKDY